MGFGEGAFDAACQLCCFQMRDRNILQLVLAPAGEVVLADLPARRSAGPGPVTRPCAYCQHLPLLDYFTLLHGKT